jgi:hypothetical protein
VGAHGGKSSCPRFRSLLPLQHLVTKAGSYGNENPAFLALPIAGKKRKALFLKGFQKLARVLLYCWYNNNNKHAPT